MMYVKQIAKILEKKTTTIDNYYTNDKLRSCFLLAMQDLYNKGPEGLVYALCTQQSKRVANGQFAQTVLDHVFPWPAHLLSFLILATRTSLRNVEWYQSSKLLKQWLKKNKSATTSSAASAVGGNDDDPGPSNPALVPDTTTATSADLTTASESVALLRTSVLASDLEEARTVAQTMKRNDLQTLRQCLGALFGHETGADREASNLFHKLKRKYGEIYPSMLRGLHAEQARTYEDLSLRLQAFTPKNLHEAVALLLWVYFDLDK